MEGMGKEGWRQNGMTRRKKETKQSVWRWREGDLSSHKLLQQTKQKTIKSSQ